MTVSKHPHDVYGCHTASQPVSQLPPSMVVFKPFGGGLAAAAAEPMFYCWTQTLLIFSRRVFCPTPEAAMKWSCTTVFDCCWHVYLLRFSSLTTVISFKKKKPSSKFVFHFIVSQKCSPKVCRIIQNFLSNKKRALWLLFAHQCLSLKILILVHLWEEPVSAQV